MKFTIEQIFVELETAIMQMSPMEKAKLRIELRRTNGLPQQPELDAYEN